MNIGDVLILRQALDTMPAAKYQVTAEADGVTHLTRLTKDGKPRGKQFTQETAVLQEAEADGRLQRLAFSA